VKAYYNENDEYAAQWLRNLIDAGHITPGDVDTRSISDVSPDDVRGYDRVHLFAGIGVWDFALNQAGWGSKQVWTGSCPCQPFSVAGKGDGFSDERHLWPEMHRLIQECNPVTVFGEQVASKDGYSWLDLVQTDLEGTGYTVGAVVAPAAGFGAPHQRHRMYWVADADEHGQRTGGRAGLHSQGEPRPLVAQCGEPGGLADAESNGQQGRPVRTAGRLQTNGTEEDGGAGGLADTLQSGRAERGAGAGSGQIAGSCGVSGLANPDSRGRGPGRIVGGLPKILRGGENERVSSESASVCGGFWSDAEWIYCRDEKYRPVEPGTFPLAHGATSRVGRLRAYGNAICAPQAEEFIKAYLEVRP